MVKPEGEFDNRFERGGKISLFMSCPSVLEMVLVQVMASFMSVFRVVTPSFMPALPHRSDMFITVQSLLSFTVEMSNFFMFISVFVDTAAA